MILFQWSWLCFMDAVELLGCYAMGLFMLVFRVDWFTSVLWYHQWTGIIVVLLSASYLLHDQV